MTETNGKKATGRPFVKGDPRCWRQGRPKSFDALRSLAQEIANEKAKSGGTTLVIDGHAVTVAEAILRQWASSKDWQRQKGFIEIAYGKVPDNLNVNASGGLELRYVNNWRADHPANAAPGAADGAVVEGALPLVDGGAPVAQDDLGSVDGD